MVSYGHVLVRPWAGNGWLCAGRGVGCPTAWLAVDWSVLLAMGLCVHGLVLS